MYLVKICALALYDIKICVIFGVQFERQIVDFKKANVDES